MIIEKSIERLLWRFNGKTAFTPNKNDIVAINDVIGFVNQKQNSNIVDNELFARMYIHMLNFMLIRYDATLFDNIPQKELHRILDRPTKQVLENLLETHNNTELGSAIENNKHDSYKPMTYEQISDIIKSMVNGAINTYSPKHLERV